jgi:MFS family permease
LLNCLVRYDDDLVTVFVHWTWTRALLHRGWWLVTSLYLVVDAGLSPSQLVLIGSAQGLAALVSEVPAGVLADTISRKWALVVSQLLMGTAMLTTGLVTAFPLLVATQVLWGLSWTFASGADVAWITDELSPMDRIPAVLAQAARAELLGSATGLLTFGVLAWATRREPAILLAGSGMLLLTCYVMVRFTEEHFVPLRTARWSSSWTIFQRGLTLVRRSRQIRQIFLATFLINGASVGGRLLPKRLLDLGLPAGLDPVLWLAGLGFVALLVGACALRLVANRVDGLHARGSYAVAAALGAVGMTGLTLAADSVAASACLLLVSGIAVPLTRLIGAIWVNSRTTSDVRATTHSFLAQAEYLGVVSFGLAIASIARLAGLPVALASCAALFALSAVVMHHRSTPRPHRIR